MQKAECLGYIEIIEPGQSDTVHIEDMCLQASDRDIEAENAEINGCRYHNSEKRVLQ